MTRKPTHEGERIAKVLARSGIASRRGAERLILAGEVSVNGRTIDSPALNITPADRVLVRGAPLPRAEPTRLWLYHKPAGVVTTAHDERGRRTIHDDLPDTLPRVMPVGRLDLNSEGLLLLTNDGALKRRLELPAGGWLRRYRVRARGVPDDATFEPLRRGIVIEGEHFAPMRVTLERQQGANVWLRVALREGRNREVRRAMEAVGLVVNRLIRVSYGPFRLGELARGEVEEISARILRDQLGIEGGAEDGADPTHGGGGDEGEKTRPRRTGGQARKRAAGPARAGRDEAGAGAARRAQAGHATGAGRRKGEDRTGNSAQTEGKKPRPAQGGARTGTRGDAHAKSGRARAPRRDAAATTALPHERAPSGDAPPKTGQPGPRASRARQPGSARAGTRAKGRAKTPRRGE